MNAGIDVNAVLKKLLKSDALQIEKLGIVNRKELVILEVTPKFNITSENAANTLLEIGDQYHKFDLT